MRKYRTLYWFAIAAASACLAVAQSSSVHSSSVKPAPLTPHTTTKPLTPKSAMPAPHKSAGVTSALPQSSNKSDAELSRLERQNIRAGSPAGASAPKVAPPKSETSASTGSGINSTYQKPAGGMKASNPGANAPYPKRVTKPN